LLISVLLLLCLYLCGLVAQTTELKDEKYAVVFVLQVFFFCCATLTVGKGGGLKSRFCSYSNYKCVSCTILILWFYGKSMAVPRFESEKNYHALRHCCNITRLCLKMLSMGLLGVHFPVWFGKLFSEPREGFFPNSSRKMVYGIIDIPYPLLFSRETQSKRIVATRGFCRGVSLLSTVVIQRKSKVPVTSYIVTILSIFFI